MNDKELIEKFYSDCSEEYRFAKNKSSKIEFDITVKYLDQYIPTNFRVLDACAGTGIYSFYLAKKGCKVVAGDLSRSSVEMMLEKQKKFPVLEDIYCSDVINMPDFKNSFDVVMCMGALYHLRKPQDIQKTIEKCIQALKPDGLFILSYLNKHAHILKSILRNGFDNSELNYIDLFGGGPLFYAMDRNRINNLLLKNGFIAEKYIATTGISYIINETIDNFNDEQYENWLRYHMKYCEDPSLLAYSQYVLCISRRKFTKEG